MPDAASSRKRVCFKVTIVDEGGEELHSDSKEYLGHRNRDFNLLEIDSSKLWNKHGSVLLPRLIILPVPIFLIILVLTQWHSAYLQQ
jgi:hypothetical protein